MGGSAECIRRLTVTTNSEQPLTHEFIRTVETLGGGPGGLGGRIGRSLQTGMPERRDAFFGGPPRRDRTMRGPAHRPQCSAKEMPGRPRGRTHKTPASLHQAPQTARAPAVDNLGAVKFYYWGI